MQVLQLGDQAIFHEGLDGFLGPPNPNLKESMKNEHCESPDSTLEWVVKNYGTRTTPKREYWVVADPSPERMVELGLKEWPKEDQTKLRAFKSTAPHRETPPGAPSRRLQKRAHTTPPLAAEHRGRLVRPFSAFQGEYNQKNAQLKAQGMEKLQKVEFYGARLYTGPMYEKYNFVLRSIGKLRTESQAEVTKDDIEIELKSELKSGAEDDSPITNSRITTKGNLYTTTLHVINSAGASPPPAVPPHARIKQTCTMRPSIEAKHLGGRPCGACAPPPLLCALQKHGGPRVPCAAVTKLGKLTAAATVYRGIADKAMPTKLRERNKENIRGGVEFAFTSCTLDREVAFHYAQNSGGRQGFAIVMEIQMGMIDRGAELSWLSQYEHEREILFAPLMGLELISYRLVSDVLVASVRPSVNLQAKTIEKVMEKMKTSHMGLLQLLDDSLKFAGAPPIALAPLIVHKTNMDMRSRDWFNSASNFLDATRDALESHTVVLKSLAHSDSRDIQSLSEHKKDRIAELAATAGEHRLATHLLLQSQAARRGNDRHADTDVVLHILERLIADGITAPWQGTFIEIACNRTAAIAPQASDAARTDSPPTPQAPVEGRTDSPHKLARQWRSFYNSRDLLLPECPLDVVEEVVRKHRGKTLAVDDGYEEGEKVKLFDADRQRWIAATVSRRYIDKPKNRKGEPLEGELTYYNVTTYQPVEAVPEHRVIRPGTSGLSSVLREASQRGDTELVTMLLGASASIFDTDLECNTPLILAAQAEQAEVCRVLVKWAKRHHEHANFKDMRNIHRQSAYDLAVGAMSRDVICVLLPTESDEEPRIDECVAEYSALLTVEDKIKHPFVWESTSKVTTLMLACRTGDENTVRELLKNPELVGAAEDRLLIRRMLELDGRMADDDEAKQKLVDEDKQKLVKDARAATLNVGTREVMLQAESSQQCTALTMACEKNYHQIVRILLDNDADVNWRDKKGRNAMSHACKSGAVEVVQALLDKAPLPDEGGVRVKQSDGKTLLMPACQYGDVDCAKLLIKNGVDINEKNKKGETAIMFAARYGHTEAVSRLLTHRPCLPTALARKRPQLCRMATNWCGGACRCLRLRAGVLPAAAQNRHRMGS